MIDEEGLVTFTADHPRNPATIRFFEPRCGPGPVVSALFFDARAEGAPGCAHEGALGACVDSVFGFCNLVSDTGGPTLNLTLRFHRPLLLGEGVRVDARLDRLDRSKIFLKGAVVSGTDQDLVYATCDGLWYNAWGQGRSSTQKGFEDSSSALLRDLPGLSSRHGTLSIHSPARVMDSPWVAELDTSEGFTRCTDLITRPSGGEHGQPYIARSCRIRTEYFAQPRALLTACQLTGECMGPPPNVHGGAIFALHADAVVACMRVCASSLGVRADRGSLKMLSVDFRRMTPLWHTYALRARVASLEHDVASCSWKATLKSEMVNPETKVLHSEATSEFECGTGALYALLPLEATQPYLSRSSPL